MPKGKRGFKCLYSTAPLPAIAAALQRLPLARLLSLLLPLPPAPLVDCCLPPQFLLLSATAIAIVAAAAPLKRLQRRLSPSPSVHVAVGIERAALALALFVARQPHCRPHHPHRHRRHRSATTLVAITLAAIATTLFVAQHLCRDPVLAAIAVAVCRRYPHHRRKRFHRRHCWRTFKSRDRQKCTTTFFQATATTATNSSKICRDRPKCTSSFWIKSETFR